MNINLLDKFARFIVGAEPNILQLCTPQEQRRVLNRAILVAFPAIIAVFSAYCAITLFTDNQWIIGFGMTAWGLIILALDRAIVIQTPCGAWSWAFLFRGALAVALSLLLAEPIVQRFFHDEIKQAEQAKKNTTNKLIDTQFTPAVQALNFEIAACAAETERLRRAYELEMNGEGGTNESGYGPIAARVERLYLEKQSECAQLEHRNRIALDSLAQFIVAEKKLQGKSVATCLAGRLRTLHNLMDEDWVIQWAVWLVRFSLLVIELLPLTLKFGRRNRINEESESESDTIYDDILELRNKEHLKSIKLLSDARQHNDLLRSQLVIFNEKINLEMRQLKSLADNRRLQISFIIERKRIIEQMKEDVIRNFEFLQTNEHQRLQYRKLLEHICENYTRTLVEYYQRFAY
jgi:Domain of unknown function (DUF4407)